MQTKMKIKAFKCYRFESGADLDMTVLDLYLDIPVDRFVNIIHPDFQFGGLMVSRLTKIHFNVPVIST